MKYVYSVKGNDDKPITQVQAIIDYYNKILDDLHDFKDLVSGYDRLNEKDIIGLNETELTAYTESGIREKHDQISDLVLYIVLIKIDIEICCKNLLLNRETGNIYEMNYFTRALATHCSDALKPQEGKLVNRINEVIRIYRNNTDYNLSVERLIANKKRLTKIGTCKITAIDELRNTLFAHRDGKGIDQHKAIKDISEGDIALTGDEINAILSDVISDLLAIQSILTPLNSNSEKK